MTCYAPLELQKRGFVDLRHKVDCGQCLGCRLERSRDWAVRCVHEAQLWPSNLFVTLTYSDSELPAGGSLVKRHFQLFMKRLRKEYPGRRISFFHCGEYGEVSFRPHYHALLFNVEFPDKVLWKRGAHGDLFVSSTLSRLWPHGFSSIGAVTFESAAYVARYVMKKVTGELASDYYGGRLPEYCTMSLRPAIGKRWFERYRNDCYPSDSLWVKGRLCKPPRYYDRLLSTVDEAQAHRVKGARESARLSGLAEATPARLRVRAEVKRAQVARLRRSVE